MLLCKLQFRRPFFREIVWKDWQLEDDTKRRQVKETVDIKSAEMIQSIMMLALLPFLALAEDAVSPLGPYKVSDVTVVRNFVAKLKCLLE